MIVAIDPGDVHVGMCTLGALSMPVQWEHRLVETTTPDMCLDVLRANSPDIVVVEEFRLYPWKAREQGFSQFLTCEMIGAIKLWHRWYSPDTKLVFQPAIIKKPTFGIMKGRGIALTPGTQHQKDAEAHMYHYLERTNSWES